MGAHLLDFDFFEGRRSALWHSEMHDRHGPSVRLGDELSLHVVELRNADRANRWGGDEPMALLPRMGFAPLWQGIKVAP